MGAVYLKAGPINVVAGKTYRFAIDAPPRGEVIRLQCVQVGGGKSTFSFALFNSAASCPPTDPANPPSTSGDTTVDPMIEYGGQIGPTRAATSNQDRYLASDGSDGGWIQFGIPYINQDAGISDAKYKIYMKFVAGGTGTYWVFITIKTTKD